VDIIGFVNNAPVVDLLVLVGLGVFLFLGVLQGAIRRLLGITSMFLAFVIAANLRNPAGEFLAQNWTQWDWGYNHLLAFLIIFFVITIASTILIQSFYKRTEVSAAHPIVDDVAGALLGLVQGFVLLLFLVIILGSYPLPSARSGDLTQLRDAQDMLIKQSHIGAWAKDCAAPPVMHLLSTLLPSDLVELYP
jgi:uncharacterized membrane protein required for colicin V production